MGDVSGDEESHGNTDILTGSKIDSTSTDILTGSKIDSTSVVENSLPMVQDLLQNFSSQADFKEQMKLAFGDSYDVSKADVLVNSWEDENLGFLPEIKIVSEGEINGANGAFAGDTETIYLAEEFVSENLGNVEAIASVIVEEYGHYFDGEVNSFDSSGDEGEIFASFVLGEELSADELLRMKVEDDWAIGFLDGEMVSIEQRTIEEELNFSAEKINNWLTPVDFTTPEPFVFFNEKIANWQETDNSGFLKFDAAIESNLKGEAFFTLGNLGETQFSYPVNLDVEMPRNALAGQAFDFLPKAPQAPEDSSRGFAKINQGTGAFELPNAGVKFELDLLQAKFSNVEIDLPNGSYKVDDNFFSFASGGSKAQLNIDLQSFLSGAGNTLLEPLNKLLTNTGVTFEIPKISEFKSFDPGGNSNNLPSIGIRGKSNNVLDFKLDVDNFILSSPLSPTSAAYNAAQTAANLAGVKLEGLGFSVEYPSSLIEETKAKEAINKLDSRKKELGIEEVILFDPANNLTPEEQEILNLQQEAVKTNSDFNSVNDAVKKERFKLKFQGDLLDIKFNGGVGVQQDFVFEPEDVQVSIEVDKGTVEQTQATGSGTPIKITPPEGSGTMTITARYELFGNIKNSIGPIIQGGVNTKLLELSGEISAFGAKVLPFQIGPVLSGQFAAATPSLELFNSSINTSEIAQNEGNKLVIERTYSIPYGPISISDASAEEGETLQFTVTLAEPSEESVNVAYQSDKGSGTVTFAAGETTKIIEIPTPDDETEEPTENFEITINPNSESSVTATGTIFDNDRPDPKPEGGQGSGHGDPHLTTFDGLYYDFQAAGEFIVAKSDSGDLEIQARQRPFIDRPVSVNSAVATKIGDQRIGFYADEDLLIQIDGQPVEIPDNESIPVGEGEIFRDGRVYTVVYPTGDQLEVNTALSFRGVNYLNYNIFLNEDREGAISGILGNNNGNTDDDIILTDGTVLEKPSREQLYGSYADSWRVTQESSLFDYEPGRDTNSFTISGFPETDITVESLDPEDVARARELIGDRLTDPILINATIIDLVLSDFDESFIEAAEQVARTPETSIIIDIEPEVVPDTATTSIDTPITINVLANDISTPGVPLSLETFPQTSAGGGIITRSDNGTPEDTTDDQLTYTPPINYSGTDTFQYTVNDGDETASGIVTVNIPSINLSRFNNGFTVNGANPGSFSGASVSNIGDFNGDQIDDFIIGALGADPNNNTAAGEAYVIFGNNNGLPSDLDLANLGNNGIVLQGVEFQGLLGTTVSEAGDVNNDGIDDLIIGAIGATANGNSNAGKAYVVFGNTQLPGSIVLSQLNGFNGFIFEGIDQFDYAGLAVGGAGDINNDGIDDLFVTAPGPLSNPPSNSYIIYGSNTGFPATVNASQLNGFNGFIITDSQGQAGSTVNNAGDINNDGIPDLIIGADANFTDSYVIYGNSSSPSFVELSSTINGSNGFVLTGIDVQNSDGTTVQGIGDVNNDGIDDIMVAVSGTTIVDNLPITKGYVVFGNPSLPVRFDLSTLNGSNGFLINDFSIDDIVGFSIGEVGDFNSDGVDDILIGTSQADTNNINAGKGYVVFGKRDGLFPANIELSTLGSQNGLVLNGSQIDDLTGAAIDGAGDVNNDGVNDLIIGAPGSLFNDAPGKSHVVFGNSNFGSSTAFVFDEAYYLTQNPDIATSVANGAFRNGLDHFSEFGVEEERDFRVLLFNENYYLNQNPDVGSLIANGEFPNGLEHFTQVGQFEGRLPSPSEANSVPLRFDEDFYLNQNLDVNNAVEQGLFSSGFEHYLEIGQFQQLPTAAELF